MLFFPPAVNCGTAKKIGCPEKSGAPVVGSAKAGLAERFSRCVFGNRAHFDDCPNSDGGKRENEPSQKQGNQQLCDGFARVSGVEIMDAQTAEKKSENDVGDA